MGRNIFKTASKDLDCFDRAAIHFNSRLGLGAAGTGQKVIGTRAINKLTQHQPRPRSKTILTSTYNNKQVHRNLTISKAETQNRKTVNSHKLTKPLIPTKPTIEVALSADATTNERIIEAEATIIFSSSSKIKISREA